MKKLSEYIFFWALGGCIYYFFEILFRGFSHWSMFVLGGICLLFFYIQGSLLHWKEPLWRQVLRCIIFVTAMEFITGIIVNKWLHLEVWDYSGLPFTAFWTNLLSVHRNIFRLVSGRNLYKRIFKLLAFWRRKTILSYTVSRIFFTFLYEKKDDIMSTMKKRKRR